MNEYNGFIVINRKMLNWEWYQDTNTVRLFLHLLLIANWEDKRWQGVEVKRGEVITSKKHLSENTGLSIQQIRTSLKKLILTNEITIKTTNKYTVIKVNNYNKYQDYNKQINNQITNNQLSNNKQSTTTKQIKQNNKEIIYNNNIYDFVERNFGRTLSPVEYEEIALWKDTDLTRYAIKQSVISNKCSIKYISRILYAYERENIKTVQQAQEREREYERAKNKRNIKPIQKTEPVPDWFDKEIKREEVKLTDEQQREFEEFERILKGE